jgi:alkylation response protein AidB-like acyl-CoA dehydrogenase
MSDLDLLPTEIEEDLRASVRDLLEDRCDPAAVIAMYDGDRSLVAPLWQALAVDLGLAGLLVPEAHGGHGASTREAAVVLEELGRRVAPVPFLTSAVVATTLLLESGHELLGDLAAGERTAALTVPFSVGPDAPVQQLSPVSAAGGTLSGRVTSVAGALEADVLLVPAAGDGRVSVYAVPAANAQIEPVPSLDMSRQLADITLDGALGELVLTQAEPAVRRALEVGAALLASEQAGVAGWCLETTVGYLKERRQFGRVVGGFQALKHRLADLYAQVESAGAVAVNAAAALAADDKDAPVATAVAQSYCSDVAVVAAEEAIQLHGGIGMTWEHPAHLYLKRAKADQIALGTAGAHRARLASLVNLPGPQS